MIRILSKMCEIEEWNFCQIQGSMSLERRAANVKTFESEPGLAIMIASLKTGGTGLNLTAASRVLLVDLWWNSAVEDQAFCRSYRRGQTRETALTRLLVRDTIDDHIVKMQQRKDNEINQVMADGASPKE